MTDYEFYWTIFHFILGQTSLLTIVYLLSKQEQLTIDGSFTQIVYQTDYDIVKLKHNTVVPSSYVRTLSHLGLTEQRAREDLLYSMTQELKKYINIQSNFDERSNEEILTGEIWIINTRGYNI